MYIYIYIFFFTIRFELTRQIGVVCGEGRWRGRMLRIQAHVRGML